MGTLVCHYVEYIEQIIYIPIIFSVFVFSGEQIAHIDAALTGVQSLRHRSCQWFLASDSKAVRCGPCTSLRGTLRAQGVRQMKKTSAAMHVNLR